MTAATLTLIGPPDLGYEDEISDQLEVRHVDNGIGSYEFWGSPGYDSRPGLELQTDEAQLEFPLDEAEAVPVVLTGTYHADDDLSLDWKATLSRVARGERTVDGQTEPCLHAYYEIEERP
jgi:hypothetical protein